MSRLAEYLAEQRKTLRHSVKCKELSFLTEDGSPLVVYLHPIALADRLRPGMGGLLSDDGASVNEAVLLYLTDHGTDESGKKLFDKSDYKAILDYMPMATAAELASRVSRVMMNADAQEEAEALGN